MFTTRTTTRFVFYCHHTTWQDLKEAIAQAITGHCRDVDHLRLAHGRAVVSGLRHNQYLASLLVAKYFAFGHPRTARSVFDLQRQESPPKILLCNALIRGYLTAGCPRLALDVYRASLQQPSAGCQPDRHTFHLAIAACTRLGEFEAAVEVEGHARLRGLDSDVLVGTTLVDMYSRAGRVVAARKVFDGMASRDVAAWNAIITGYSRAGSLSDAVSLYREMRSASLVSPTETTLVSLISGCGCVGSLELGEVVHAEVVKLGFGDSMFILNSLMEMYIVCDRLTWACELFNTMVSKDAVSWSTMIGGYVQYGQPYDALKLFHLKVFDVHIPPTRPILLNALLACADLGDYEEGELIAKNYLMNDGSMFSSDPSLMTALIYMYLKCGKMETAIELLGRDEVKHDIVAWNVAIKACIELGMVNKVLDLMRELQRRDIPLDYITIITFLSALSCRAYLNKVMEMHGVIIKRGFEAEVQIANSLIDVYAKSGSINESDKVFEGITEKDVVSWSIMIKAYAWTGKINEALNLFELMQENKLRPNQLTFLSLLSACSHSGLVDKGWELFNCMRTYYGLEPSIEHLTSMVDMFCRAARLNDAYDLLQSVIPVCGSNAALWGTLLSACRLHGDLMIGEAAARNLLNCEPENVGNYTMLADIYISTGKREEANKVIELLKTKAEKRHGCSWIEGGC